MKVQNRSDRQILSALLYSGKLVSGEEKAFRSMLESLDGGQVRLSPNQRKWAEQLYDKFRLEDKPDKGLIKSKTAKAQERQESHPLDEMRKNLPLKPPGKS